MILSQPEGQRKPFPEWLKKRVQVGDLGEPVRKLLDSLHLDTVCRGAHCPNQCECFAKGTATFMILGSVCSRSCRFCAIGSGTLSPVEEDEPGRLAEACTRMGLRHVVITSVTRDDLPDGGARHFARTIRAVRQRCTAVVEVLTPDFRGDEAAIDMVVAARPDIFNHNIETIRRLYPQVRPQADYAQSLRVLEYAKNSDPGIHTKSGMMVGLGETNDEVLAACADLREAGCDILTIGQYLRPTPDHLPIERFVTPEEFEDYRRRALEMGFLAAAAGPFVRSSYNAREVFEAVATQPRNG
jgi:lipoic acid synthetase